MSSAARVFGIPELLETILQNGMAKDLFLQQQVNKTWQEVISCSSRLQQKLFLRADSSERNKFASLKWNPCLVRLGGKLCPMSLGHCCFVISAKALEAINYPNASWKNMFLTLPTTSRIEMYRSQASWTKSFLKLPEMNMAQRADVGRQITSTVINEDGITMGQLTECRGIREGYRCEAVLEDKIYIQIKECRGESIMMSCFGHI